MESSTAPSPITTSPSPSIRASSAPITRAPALVSPGERSSRDRKSTRLNSSHLGISYAVFCLKKKNRFVDADRRERQHVCGGLSEAYRQAALDGQDRSRRCVSGRTIAGAGIVRGLLKNEVPG